MTQSERRVFLIKDLLCEKPEYWDLEIPQSAEKQKKMLRSLFNLRMPYPTSEEFLRVQDEYLRYEIRSRGITDITDLDPIEEDLYLWQGDITTLRCDAIVNAANSRMLGCFCPCHSCIDNAIHTFSGIQLRSECAELMQKQGYEEPTGAAKLTAAYNLPCKYILHTVGPIVSGQLSCRDCEQLDSCYHSCLVLAEKQGLQSIAFCCISTGEFHFPNDKAAQIAISAVRTYKMQTHSKMKVIFNVFKEIDWHIYRQLLR